MDSTEVTSTTIKKKMEDQMWKTIRMHAKNDPILQDMLNRVIMFWQLKYDNEDPVVHITKLIN